MWSKNTVKRPSTTVLLVVNQRISAMLWSCGRNFLKTKFLYAGPGLTTRNIFADSNG